MPVLAIVDDLIFRSKIQTTATPAGGDVRLVRPAAAESAFVEDASWELVLLDLSIRDAVPMVARIRERLPRVPIVGFAAHVQLELQRQAREAGCTAVVPNSVFVQWLPELVLGRIPSYNSPQ
jgi:CheY-like chemotaxis protein